MALVESILLAVRSVRLRVSPCRPIPVRRVLKMGGSAIPLVLCPMIVESVTDAVLIDAHASSE